MAQDDFPKNGLLLACRDEYDAACMLFKVCLECSGVR